MAIRFHNATVGLKGGDGKYFSKPSSPAASQAGHVSLAWDDVAVTNMNQLRDTVAVLLRQIESAGLKQG